MGFLHRDQIQINTALRAACFAWRSPPSSIYSWMGFGLVGLAAFTLGARIEDGTRDHGIWEENFGAR